MNSEKLLILGCGDLGRRLTQCLNTSHYCITGVRRRPPLVAEENIRYVACDLNDQQALTDVLRPGFDIILATLTPAERSDAGYKKGYVDVCRHLLQSLQTLDQQPRLLIFVSSTGVYGQDDGSWVDEASPAQPTSFSGQRLLEAEQLIRGSGHRHCVVRFSGIYGPGRNRLIEQVQERRATLTPGYSNRIHADDCAAVLGHLIELRRQGGALAPVYLASDCEPAPMAEVVQWLARALGVELPDSAHVRPSENMNKRCRNKLLLSTGFKFRYADYRSGYRALLADAK